MDEPAGDLAGAPLGFFLFKRIDQFDGGEEPDALAVMLDGWTPIAVARCVLPVPGPPTRTTL